MRGLVFGGLLVVSALALGQEGPGADQRQTSYQKMTPEQRAAATREFLGLGAQPDKLGAARGAPIFQQNCGFCHGPQARGATGPSLITSDVVLGDDHGEHLAPYVKQGRPDKGMPSFADMPDAKLKDIAEFLHLEVENVANRGAYHVLNIVVGAPARGQTYVASHCMSCHTTETFAHLAGKFRSPDQLQRGWVWPSRSSSPSLGVTATVRMPDGATISGQVAQVSDFRITVVDAAGRKLTIDRDPGVEVNLKDPLAPHQQMLMTLANEDMHNVTAWLETLK